MFERNTLGKRLHLLLFTSPSSLSLIKPFSDFLRNLHLQKAQQMDPFCRKKCLPHCVAYVGSSVATPLFSHLHDQVVFLRPSHRPEVLIGVFLTSTFPLSPHHHHHKVLKGISSHFFLFETGTPIFMGFYALV